MRGDGYDFDMLRERHREMIKEAEMWRLAQRVSPGWKERLEIYRHLLNRLLSGISSSEERVERRRAFPVEEEVARSGAGLVEAVFEQRSHPVVSSSVIEFHRKEEEYVIREVDLATGDHTLYLSTEDPEWANWIWERKTCQHRSPEARI